MTATTGPDITRRDDGAFSVELAASTVVFLIMLALVLAAGRVSNAGQHVSAAAQEGARIATLQATPAAATAVAIATVDANLDAAGVACTSGLAVDVNATSLAPGGRVTVAVTCTTSMRDLAALRMPGTRTLTATATELVDVYRSDP